MIRFWPALMVVMLAACTESNTADERLRTYLALPPSIELTEQNVRIALLRQIPLGTSANDVEKQLIDAGIGRDKLSSYTPPDAKGIALIRIEFDPTTFGFIKNSYEIPLTFNPGVDMHSKLIHFKG